MSYVQQQRVLCQARFCGRERAIRRIFVLFVDAVRGLVVLDTRSKNTYRRDRYNKDHPEPYGRLDSEAA